MRRCIIYFILFPALLLSQVDETRIPLSAIHPEMKKFLAEHITQKKMTPEIMQYAMVHFINQFDLEHVYLLESEVKPFLTMSHSQLKDLVEAYDREDYSIFEKINTQIQESIRKVRLFRRTLVVNIDQFQKWSQEPLPGVTDMNEGDPNTFAKNEVELERLHAIYMSHLVGRQLQTFKSLNQNLTFLDAVRDVELEMEEFENSYLYLNKEGKPVDAKEQENLLAGHILKALTASLDVHSEFFNKKEAESLKMKLEKEYEGAGVVIEQEGDAFVVGAIIKGSSADINGKISLGDELISIDQTKTKELTNQEVEAKLAGPVGSYVDLGFRRGSQETFHTVLERRHTVLQEGRVDTIFENVSGGIVGVVQLHSFYQGEGELSSEHDVELAIKSLAKKGSIKGLVLDLRDNRGGFLLQAVKVAGLFIKTGVVVAAKYSDGTIKYFRDTNPKIAYAGPLIILTSRETASAAEIVAQALKDYGVAIIVGDEKTFGKGSIQTQTVTGDKSQESLFKVTIGEYYSVSGHSTQLEGVKADIVVPSLSSEKKVGEAYLSETIKSDKIAPSFNDTLSDVDPSEKGWYEKYYIPFLQQKTDVYRKWIPELARKSRQRLAKNINYQNLLHGELFLIERHGLTDEKVPLDQKAAQRAILNLQLQEAMDITKDLINLTAS